MTILISIGYPLKSVLFKLFEKPEIQNILNFLKARILNSATHPVLSVDLFHFLQDDNVC
jgi:hypothetical protein